MECNVSPVTCILLSCSGQGATTVLWHSRLINPIRLGNHHPHALFPQWRIFAKVLRHKRNNHSTSLNQLPSKQIDTAIRKHSPLFIFPFLFFGNGTQGTFKVASEQSIAKTRHLDLSICYMQRSVALTLIIMFPLFIATRASSSFQGPGSPKTAVLRGAMPSVWLCIDGNHGKPCHDSTVGACAQ